MLDLEFIDGSGAVFLGGPPVDRPRCTAMPWLANLAMNWRKNPEGCGLLGVGDLDVGESAGVADDRSHGDQGFTNLPSFLKSTSISVPEWR